ncbi:MAG: ribose 5-phosphate isomerase B [Actinomycetota bacterium]|nr:ribose 5-phosphate isomerase B [Actinomycetota bacterium]
MSEQPPQLEDEVRDLVRNIVTGVLDDAGRVPPLPEREAPPSPIEGVTTIAIGSDHGGFALKERLAFRLKETGHDVHDCGTDSTEAVDYPDYAHEVARLVADGSCRSGIIIDGAGIGSAMVANKVPGVRAALCYDLSTARNSREHNHANVLTLGAGLIGSNLAWQIVKEWLATPWGEGRHAARVDKIMKIENRYAGGSP